MALNLAAKIGNNQFVVIQKNTCYNRINAVLDAFEHKKMEYQKILNSAFANIRYTCQFNSHCYLKRRIGCVYHLGKGVNMFTSSEIFINLVVITGFILIHLTSIFLLDKKGDVQTFNSFAAGVGISYAIIHLLPRLAYFQSVLIDEFGWSSGLLYTHGVYAIVLVGLVLSYIAYKIDERSFNVLVKKDLASAKKAYFWSDISFHMIYNVMIGYLVIANTLNEPFYVVTYFVAFGLHFLMNDWHLFHHHGGSFAKMGRFFLIGAILLGAAISMLWALPYFVLVSIEALITGALLMNIIKFELPDGGEGSIKVFLLGTICSGILFIFI